MAKKVRKTPPDSRTTGCIIPFHAAKCQKRIVNNAAAAIRPRRVADASGAADGRGGRVVRRFGRLRRFLPGESQALQRGERLFLGYAREGQRVEPCHPPPADTARSPRRPETPAPWRIRGRRPRRTAARRSRSRPRSRRIRPPAPRRPRACRRSRYFASTTVMAVAVAQGHQRFALIASARVARGRLAVALHLRFRHGRQSPRAASGRSPAFQPSPPPRPRTKAAPRSATGRSSS